MPSRICSNSNGDENKLDWIENAIFPDMFNVRMFVQSLLYPDSDSDSDLESC